MKWIIKLRLYRPLMKLTHRYGWHYAPVMKPIEREGIDSPLHWCEWCGLRGRTYRAKGPLGGVNI